jgi:hypothetical protein
MKMKRLVIILALVLAYTMPAYATDHQYKFGFRLDVEFTLDETVGDYYTDNSVNHIAHGVFVKFVRQVGTVKWSGWADASTGLLIATLSDQEVYDVIVQSKTRLEDDNVIHVLHDHNDQTLFEQEVLSNWQPPSTPPSGYTYLVYDYNPNYKISNVLAATGYALTEKPAAVSNHTYYYYCEPCSGTVDGNCFNPNISPEGVQMSLTDRGGKFGMCHELGHNIEWVWTGGFTNDCSWTAEYESEDTCKTLNGGHNWGSKEYDSCAANEALAGFYAAAVWNDNTENNCQIGPTSNYKDCNENDTVLETHCNIYPADHPLKGFGVEGDWIQFGGISLTPTMNLIAPAGR